MRQDNIANDAFDEIVKGDLKIFGREEVGFFGAFRGLDDERLARFFFNGVASRRNKEINQSIYWTSAALPGNS